MSQQLITEAIRKVIGVESEPVVRKVNKRDIKRWARVTQDLNPLWNDEEQARKTRYGGLVAPPIFLYSLSDFDWARNNLSHIDCPLKGVLAGGLELEFYAPIRAGDIIYVTHKLVDARVKEGKSGTMVFLVAEAYYRSKQGKLLAKQTRTTIRI